MLPFVLELRSTDGEPGDRVFLATTHDGHLVEFSETWSVPHLGTPGWMVSVSPSLGCPVGCVFCDGGAWYKGKLDAAEILAQIDHVVALAGNEPDPAQPLWIEFSKVGEPSFNPAVLEVLCQLPRRYPGRAISPCLSTVAPQRTEAFFEELLAVRHCVFGPDGFQLRLSLHATDERLRHELIPIKLWSFEKIAAFGRRFCRPGDRKVALRFAASPSIPLDVGRLLGTFSPEVFSIELTPMNPTQTARAHGLTSAVTADDLAGSFQQVDAFRSAGFDVTVCFGAPEADALGASCGMSLTARLDTPLPPRRRRTHAAPAAPR